MPPGEPPKPEPPPSQVGQDVIQAMLVVARQAPPGPFLEVGVYQGGTAWHLGELALEQGRELWLYDTFDGIPYAGPHDSHKVGDFRDTTYAQVALAIPHAHIIAGIFPASAQGPDSSHRWFPRERLAFVHLDCDQERAYREAIAFLRPRMARGGYMWFDDAPCLPGATQAVLEAFSPAELSLTRGKYYVKIGGPP